MDIKSPNFAFLAACQTSAGGVFPCMFNPEHIQSLMNLLLAIEMPDEAMHIAAGFQFAGFWSIISTIWTIRDKDGPRLAEQVYCHLFRDQGRTPNATEAGEALGLAIRRLKMDIPVERLVPFVHIGV
jgi:CHAT domain-containing protein